MIPTVQRHSYQAFGFRIDSEIPLPELPIRQENDGGVPDIRIQTADLWAEWSKLAEPHRKSVVASGRILFLIPGMALFDIREGRYIRVSPLEEADDDQIRLYILGTCMGAIMLQRGILPLHGSAVAIGGHAYAIIGDSGAGKSTLASAFLQQGYSLASDDVIAVTFAEDGTPMAASSYPQQKLWQESLDGFGMERGNYRPIFRRETKFAVPVTAQFQEAPLPLAGLFELVKTDAGMISVEPVRSLDRLAVLHRHTYRHFWIERLGAASWHFQMMTKLSNRASLHRLRRPSGGFTAPDLVAAILKTIGQDG
jgi:hypothetical protein